MARLTQPNWRDHLALDIRDYAAGVLDDGTADCTDAFTRALADAATTGRRRILLPYEHAGRYAINDTLLVQAKGITFESTGRWRPTESGGVALEYHGTGPLFQLGTDDGNSWDSNEYNGIASEFSLLGVYLKHVAPDTALANGLGNYKAGSYAIQDWRGGGARLWYAGIENFDYPYWGVQADISEFSNVVINYAHSGAYFGPRSDQVTFYRTLTFGCDCELQLDGPMGFRARDCQFVGGGTASAAPIIIDNTFNKEMAVMFEDCWFEHYQGIATTPALVDIGVGSTNPVKNVTFRNPILNNNPSGGGSRAQYFARLGNADGIVIDHPSYGALFNFDAFLASTGTQTVDVRLRGGQQLQGHHAVTNLSSGTVRVHGEYFGFGNTYIQNASGKVQIGRGDSKDVMFVTGFSDGWFQADQPGRSDGNTALINFQRRITSGSAAPTSSTWAVGDKCLNTSPAETGTAGSKYVVLGWICTAAGTPGTWLPFRCLTGN